MSEHMAYVGRCNHCKSPVAACVDDPKYASETRKFVRETLRDGCFIERHTCQWVRENLRPCAEDCACRHCLKKRAKKAEPDMFAETPS